MKQAEAVGGADDVAVANTSGGRAIYTRTAVLGLLIVAGALAFVTTRLLLLGLSFDEIVPLAVFLTVTLLSAVLVWRFGTWAKVLGVIVALALLGMYLPFIVIEIVIPQSFLDFAPTLGALVGCLVAIAGGIAALIRRRDRRSAATPGERRIALAVLVGLGAMLALSAVLTLTSRATVAASDRVGASELVMVDFEFDQAAYRATAGEPTRFVVANRDASWHSFTIDELGIDVRVLPGSEALVEIPASAEPGIYTLYCVPHTEIRDGEHTGMVATLEVAG